jgi:hypothetical protein
LANRDEIYSLIAPGLSSILSVNATEANAKTGKSTLIDFKVYPMLKKIGDVVTTKIMPMYNDGLLCEPEDIRVTDRVMLMREMEVYSKTHTVDEVREKYWQDKPLQDFGSVLVNIAQTQAKPKPDIVSSRPIINQPIEKQVEENKPDEPEEKVKDIRPAMLEIDKWERKSNKLGKLAEFEAYNIPGEIVDSINNGTTFEEARKMLRSESIKPIANALMFESQKRDYSYDALKAIADAINNANMIEAVKQQSMSIMMPAITLNANMPDQGQSGVTVNIPEQPTPIVNIAQPNIAVKNEVNPTPIKIENNVKASDVIMPEKSDFTVQRDSQGKIVGMVKK